MYLQKWNQNIAIPENQNENEFYNKREYQKINRNDSKYIKDFKDAPFEMDSRCISSMNNDKIFKNKVQNPLRNSQIMKNNGMNSSFSSKFWQSQIQNIGGGNC